MLMKAKMEFHTEWAVPPPTEDRSGNEIEPQNETKDAGKTGTATAEHPRPKEASFVSSAGSH